MSLLWSRYVEPYKCAYLLSELDILTNNSGCSIAATDVGEEAVGHSTAAQPPHRHRGY